MKKEKKNRPTEKRNRMTNRNKNINERTVTAFCRRGQEIKSGANPTILLHLKANFLQNSVLKSLVEKIKIFVRILGQYAKKNL